jgi:hypothetical protein
MDGKDQEQSSDNEDNDIDALCQPRDVPPSDRFAPAIRKAKKRKISEMFCKGVAAAQDRLRESRAAGGDDCEAEGLGEVAHDQRGLLSLSPALLQEIFVKSIMFDRIAAGIRLQGGTADSRLVSGALKQLLAAGVDAKEFSMREVAKNLGVCAKTSNVILGSRSPLFLPHTNTVQNDHF